MLPGYTAIRFRAGERQGGTGAADDVHHSVVWVLQALEGAARPRWRGDHRGRHRARPGRRGVRDERQRWQPDRADHAVRRRKHHGQPVCRPGPGPPGGTGRYPGPLTWRGAPGSTRLRGALSFTNVLSAMLLVNSPLSLGGGGSHDLSGPGYPDWQIWLTWSFLRRRPTTPPGLP